MFRSAGRAMRALRAPAIAGLVLGSALPGQAQSGSTFIVDSANDSIDAMIGDGVCADANGDCSLRAAVQEANAAGMATTIQIDVTTVTLTIMGGDEDLAATGDLDILGQVTIMGNGATLDANEIDRAFDLVSGDSEMRPSLSVDMLTVTNGAPPIGESGGGYRSAGSLTLTHSSVTASDAVGTGASGGAIANLGGTLSVTSSTLSGNSATRAGGAIEDDAGTTTISMSEISGNTAGPMPGNGGGIHITGPGRVTVTASNVLGNSAAAEGGGLWTSAAGTLSVSETTLMGNTASGDDADQGGGAIFSDGGIVTVLGSTISGNMADGTSGSGGGILNNGGSLTLSNTTLSGNISNRAGGGIEENAGTTDVIGSSFFLNSTAANPGNGGGIHITGAGEVTVSDTSFSGNTAAAEGGALWTSGSGTLIVSDCPFAGNTASGDDTDQGGGAIFNDRGMVAVTNSQFVRNVANGRKGSGGGILNKLGSLTVSNSVFSRNTSQRAGGAIEARLGTTSVSGSTLLRNAVGSTPGNGGAIHLTGLGTVNVSGSIVSGNLATNEGGGIWNSTVGTTTVTSTTISGNTAPTGPDVFNNGGTFTIDAVPVLAGP